MFRMEVPLLPMRAVLFPGAKLSVTISDERGKRLVEGCPDDRRVGVVLSKYPHGSGGPKDCEDWFEIGTLARIIHWETTPENQITAFLRGEQRIRLIEIVQREPYLVGRVEILPSRFASISPQLTCLANRIAAMLYRYIELLETANKLALADMILPTDLMSLGYRVGALLDVPLQEKQELLEVENIDELLMRELEILDREIKRLQQSAFWYQFVRGKAIERALPLERAIWN